MTMQPPTEYRVSRDKETGIVNWQHRQSDDLGGDVYKRPYPDVLSCVNDLADKFGRRFASKIERELAVRTIF